MLKSKAGDPIWGWKMLMHDLRNPDQTEQPIAQQSQQVQSSAPPQNISNIVNYPPTAVPQTMGKFRFALIYAIIITVILLVIAGVLLWKLGVIDYLIETCRSLMQ